MVKGKEQLAGLNDAWRIWCEWVLDRADEAGFAPRVTSGFRTRDEQVRIYARYKAGKVRMAAAPGNSSHERGLAIDVVSESGQQNAMIRLFKKFGAETVSNDPPHFQYPGFVAWRAALQRSGRW